MGIRKVAEQISDRCKLAVLGLGGVFRRPKYACLGIFCWFLILFILCFWQDGSGNWQLIWSGLPLDRKIEVLGRVLSVTIGSFGSFTGLVVVFLALLQAVVITQLVFTWRHRDRGSAIDGASTGGIGAILGFIALGCPSCGVGLLTPILSAIAGASAVALAETIGFIFTLLAFALLIFTVIRLGYIDFVLISSNRAKESHVRKSN